MSFQIFTDTSSGLDKKLREQYKIEYFRMGLIVNDKQYLGDLDFVDFSRDEMYDWVRNPDITIRTSLVTFEEYQTKSEEFLKKGIDVLYIACAGALSGSRGNFEIVRKDLEEKYPDRKIISIDSVVQKWL